MAPGPRPESAPSRPINIINTFPSWTFHFQKYKTKKFLFSSPEGIFLSK